MGLIGFLLLTTLVNAQPRAEIGAGFRFPGTALTLRFHPQENSSGEVVSGFHQKAPFYNGDMGLSPTAAVNYAILAIPLETKPGRYTLRVDYVENGKPESETLKVTVVKRPGRVKKIILPAKALKASGALADEKPILDKGFQEAGGPPLWRGAFSLPVVARRISEAFGVSRRYLPGDMLWRHKGLDLPVEVGSPVIAANEARVLVAREGLKAYGGLVVLGHGYDLCSTYMHLSKVLVKEGQIVRKGELIALSGKEGIATGPHLHFQMNLRGFAVDPRPWIDKTALAGLK